MFQTKPFTGFYFHSCARNKHRIGWNILYNVQPCRLIIFWSTLPLDVIIRIDEVRYIIAYGEYFILIKSLTTYSRDCNSQGISHTDKRCDRIFSIISFVLPVSSYTSRIAQCSGSSSSLTLPFGKPHELLAKYDCTSRTLSRSLFSKIAP